MCNFLKQGVQYRELKIGDELEYICVEVWTKEGGVSVVNFYNPCKQIESGHLGEIWEGLGEKVIWCGDFNAHSSLWGDKNDVNGNVIEEFIEDN